ncbi:MAG: hypothetical protein WDZ79_00850 [Candidatus Paceibacterota bacterium]
MSQDLLEDVQRERDCWVRSEQVQGRLNLLMGIGIGIMLSGIVMLLTQIQ